MNNQKHKIIITTQVRLDQKLLLEKEENQAKTIRKALDLYYNIEDKEEEE